MTENVEFNEKEGICISCGQKYIPGHLEYCPECCRDARIDESFQVWVILSILLSIGGFCVAPGYAAADIFNSDVVGVSVFFFMLAVVNLAGLIFSLRAWKKKK